MGFKLFNRQRPDAVEKQKGKSRSEGNRGTSPLASAGQDACVHCGLKPAFSSTAESDRQLESDRVISPTRITIANHSSPSSRKILSACQMAIENQLARQAAIPRRPHAMAAFDQLYRQTWCPSETPPAVRPRVGTLCNFFPEEIIYAVGAMPVRLDIGLSPEIDAESRLPTPDICPSIKSFLGAIALGFHVFNHLDALILPTSCDGKRKLAQILDDKQRTYILELPQTRDAHRNRESWLIEVKTLAQKLAKLTGVPLRSRRLRRTIEKRNQQSALLRKLIKHRFKDTAILSGRDFMLAVQTSFFTSPEQWIECTRTLLAEMENCHRAFPIEKGTPSRSVEGEPIPLYVTGSPIYFPAFELLNIIEENRAVIISDDLCSSTERLYHPTVIDEPTLSGMLSALAERTLLPCTCPCFAGKNHRIDRILERVRQSGARGVIHHTLRMCQLFEMEAPLVSTALKAANTPILSIQTDYGGDSSAAIKNRLDAFLEMLEQ